MSSPLQKSLKYLRQDESAVVWVTEYWSPFPKPHGLRHDLLGFIDVLLLQPGVKPVGVQVTSYSNMGARMRKIEESDLANKWHDHWGEIHVHGWKKVRNRWHLVVAKALKDKDGWFWAKSDPIPFVTSN